MSQQVVDEKNEIENYMPEECVAKIISFTSIADAACIMPLVSKMFKSAADSDHVWDNFLPSDLDSTYLFSDPSLISLSKKQLFVRLCIDPLLIDHGKKILGLDKHTGKKCFMVAPRELMISWGDNGNYWRWISLQSSRFAEVAELLNVWWFDIRGRIQTKLLSPQTTYAIYLVFKLKENERSQGFHTLEVSIELQTGLFESRQIRWQPQERRPHNEWKEIKIGEFYNACGNDGWVEMRLWDVNSYKTGLFVQGIEFRPIETCTPFT